jgi:hypothetical protein
MVGGNGAWHHFPIFRTPEIKGLENGAWHQFPISAPGTNFQYARLAGQSEERRAGGLLLP